MSITKHTSWHHLPKIQIGGRWKTIFHCFFVGYRDHPYHSAPELSTAMQSRTSPCTKGIYWGRKEIKLLEKVKMFMKMRPTTYILYSLGVLMLMAIDPADLWHFYRPKVVFNLSPQNKWIWFPICVWINLAIHQVYGIVTKYCLSLSAKG